MALEAGFCLFGGSHCLKSILYMSCLSVIQTFQEGEINQTAQVAVFIVIFLPFPLPLFPHPSEV